MKFLIKFEEAIDKLILALIEKMKGLTPSFVQPILYFIKNLPQLFLTGIKILKDKTQSIIKKILSYFSQYLIMINGHLVGIQIYLRSEEFKNRNKIEMLLAPIKKFKTDPIKASGVLAIILFFGFSSYFIGSNAHKIFMGSQTLRTPASSINEEPIVEFKKLNFKIAEQLVSFDIIIEASNINEKDELEKNREIIEKNILSIKIHAQDLPLKADEIDAFKSQIMNQLTAHHVRSILIKQILGKRPKYFMQIDKLIAMKNLNLQIFLEDTRRNRQVWIDYTALSSNRNVVLYLQDHDVQLRDHINTYVEPVIPQLPIEDEGRQIIKDKMKLEMNEFLKKAGIEGSIQEIYIDYLIVS